MGDRGGIEEGKENERRGRKERSRETGRHRLRGKRGNWWEKVKGRRKREKESK